MTVRSRLALAALVPLALGLVLLWDPPTPPAARGAAGPAPSSPPAEVSPRRPHGLSSEAASADGSATLESVSPIPATRVEAFEPARFLVVDDEGHPIEGAVVREQAQVPTSGVTGADGRCELQLQRSAGFWFEIRADGHGGVRDFHHRTGERRVELPAAVTVRGRVLEEGTRRPIPYATVRASGGGRTIDAPLAEADGDGRFRVMDVPALDEMRLYASAPGFGGEHSTWDLVGADDAGEIELFLVPETPFEVVVLDDTGAPFSELEVGSGMTDAAGRIALALTPNEAAEGRLTVSVDALDYYEVVLVIDLDAPSPLELRLPRAAICEGFVRDLAGRAVQGARLTFTPKGGKQAYGFSSFPVPHGEILTHRGGGTSAMTDERGWYRSRPLAPPVGPFAASVSSADHPDLDGIIVEVQPGITTRLDLVLDGSGPQPRGTLRGRVSLNGAPVDADAVWRNEAGAGRIRTGGRRRLRGEPEGVQGVFEGAVPVGQTELWVEFDDHHLVRAGQYLPGTRAAVEVVAEQVVEHDFEFELPMGEVGGRVMTAEGVPLREGLVSVVDTKGRFVQRASTDLDGRWRDAVPDLGWEYVASLTHAGVTARREGVRAGDLAVELTLPALGTLLVRVLDDETSEVLQEWELSYGVRGEDRKYQGRALSPSTNAARPGGWFPLELRPGVLDLWVQAPELGYQSRRVEGVRVTTGDNAPVEVRLERGLEQEFVLAEGCDRPRDHQVQLLLLEDELWDTLHHGDEIEPGEPTIPFGNDAYQYGHGPHYSAGTLSTRMLHFDEHHRATLKGLAHGTWRFKAPAGVVVEPARVVLPHEGPLEVRWRRMD